MNSEKKKALGYVRISSQRQINNESPETQRKIIQNYADTHGIEIIEWFEDIAASAKNADRRELQNMLEFASKYKGKIDHVIVYKMIRASRDLESYILMVRSALRAKGITMRSATEPIDDTKEGRFFELFHVLIGQLDNEGKAETTVHNMRALANQGYWQHPPIVGYETYKVPNEAGKIRPSLKPNSMAKKVRAVLERFSEGDINKAELSRFAAEIGLRSRYGKKLGEDSINRLLKSPTYAGYVCDKFTDYELVEGRHEGIIPKATYERNQELLHGKKNRIGERHNSFNELYPLKGLLLCLNCGQPLYASAPRTGNGGRSPRYHCSRSSCIGKVRSVGASKVHSDFIDLLKRTKPSDNVLKLYKEILIREANHQLGSINKEIKRKRDQLNDIGNTRVNAITKFAEGSLTEEEKEEVIGALDKQKFDISIQLKDLENQQNIRETDIEAAINFMERVDKQWELAGLEVQYRFQSMIFPEGLRYDPETSRFGTSQISPLYRVIPNKKASNEALKTYLVAGAGLEPATSWL